jgi:hypothetical protein
VVLPVEEAEPIEELGWGRVIARLPAAHVLFAAAEAGAHRAEADALVLCAYSFALS